MCMVVKVKVKNFKEIKSNLKEKDFDTGRVKN